MKQKGLSDIHFDAFLRCLEVALERVGVFAVAKTQALTAVEAERDRVLNRAGGNLNRCVVWGFV